MGTECGRGLRNRGFFAIILGNLFRRGKVCPAASRHKVPGEGCLLNRLKQRITWCGLLLTALAVVVLAQGTWLEKADPTFARMTQQTLIIDPGHGGEDGGAVSVSGKSESQMCIRDRFLMATVLIIYYKQISEGYEDKARFAIMEKVGMSQQQIRSAIRSQVRAVFFLPLLGAVIHLLAAFKMITKLMSALNLTNVSLFALCCLGTVVVFGMGYFIIYHLTARTYYKICLLYTSSPEHPGRYPGGHVVPGGLKPQGGTSFAHEIVLRTHCLSAFGRTLGRMQQN